MIESDGRKVGDRNWVEFYKSFLGDVVNIFGEYTWASGRERYIVYEDTQGRVMEYDDADGTTYLISPLADPGEIERVLATRYHRDSGTLDIIPPRNHDIDLSAPFKSRFTDADFNKEDV